MFEFVLLRHVNMRTCQSFSAHADFIYRLHNYSQLPYRNEIFAYICDSIFTLFLFIMRDETSSRFNQ